MKRKITRIARHPAIYLPRSMENLIGTTVDIEVKGDGIVIRTRKIDPLTRLKALAEELLSIANELEKEVMRE